MIPLALAGINPIRLGIAIAFVALAAYAGIQTVRVADLKTDLAEEKLIGANERAALFKLAADAKGKIAKIQSDHAAQQQENSDEYAKARAKNQTRLAAVTAESERLSRQLSDYAAGRDLGPDTDAPACRGIRDRAAAIGDLLEQARGLATVFAGAAEQHADEVRVLKGQITADRVACQAL
jgi:hypothetical protein